MSFYSNIRFNGPNLSEDIKEIEELELRREILLQEINEYKQNYKEIKQMLKNNVVVFREVQNSYKEIFPKFQKIEKQLKELQEQLVKTQKEYDIHHKQIKVLKEVMENKETENQECEKQMSKLKEKILYNNKQIQQIQKELDEKQYKEWYEILKQWEENGGSLTMSLILKNKVEERLKMFLGIPDNCRGSAWQLMSRTNLLKIKQQHYAHSTNHLYYILLEQPSKFEKVISKDIHRSFPNDEFRQMMLENNRISSLFNVLKAYSNWDPYLGYCQGMNFLVGLLLLYMDQENAFWMFLVLMQSYKMVGLFQQESTMLPLFMRHFNNEFKKFQPLLHSHFKSQNVESPMYLTEWFTTMFVYSLPRQTAALIWDIFFFEGGGQHVLFKAGLALLKLYENVLLEAPMEEILIILKKRIRNVHPKELCSEIQKIKLSTTTLEFLNSIEVECQIFPKGRKLYCVLKHFPDEMENFSSSSDDENN